MIKYEEVYIYICKYKRLEKCLPIVNVLVASVFDQTSINSINPGLQFMLWHSSSVAKHLGGKYSEEYLTDENLASDDTLDLGPKDMIHTWRPMSSQMGVVPSSCRSMLVFSKFFALFTSKSVTEVASLIHSFWMLNIMASWFSLSVTK